MSKLTLRLIRKHLLLCFLSAIPFISFSQASDNAKPVFFPENFLNEISTKASRLEAKLDAHEERSLKKLEREEKRLKKKLAKLDSVAANEVFGNAEDKYNQLQQTLQNPGKSAQYIPYLDTLKTSLKFIDQNPAFISTSKDKLRSIMGKVEGLETKLQRAEEIRKFLRERRQYLKEQLTKFGFVKDLKNLNKQVYYYTGQLNEYKTLLQDKKKTERKVIEALSSTKLFRDLIKKHGMLAGLFRLPGELPPGPSAGGTSLGGLQTRSQVSGLLQQQLGTNSGTTGLQQLQQTMQKAQGQLQQLKNKIIQSGGDSDPELPDFKPNQQKTKSFLKRLEFGTNFQTQKTKKYFPATSDIGLSLGYKLNDKSIIGIGASYKLGLGTDWRHIRISHQGLGLRSFADIKLNGSLWISGGFEMNYLSAFKSISELKEFSAWQQSGLLGLSKTVLLKTKFFKKTKLQLLWDFLSYRQLPRSQPILFRVGYHF